jgi:hypothetical protein
MPATTEIRKKTNAHFSSVTAQSSGLRAAAALNPAM